MSDPGEKRCTPATCDLCKRPCTTQGGELADYWACRGHSLIIQSNELSWDLGRLPTHQEFWKMVEREGFSKGKLTPEERDKIKATPEWQAAMSDPVYVEFRALKTAGIDWLMENPEPQSAPICSECDQDASCQSDGRLYCRRCWLDEKDREHD